MKDKVQVDENKLWSGKESLRILSDGPNGLGGDWLIYCCGQAVSETNNNIAVYKIFKIQRFIF